MCAASSEGASLSPASSLQRGKACLACRRRKMRCDGARPTCGQCVRGNRVDDCEYTDGQRRSRTQTLEEDIARLRARVQELENPEQAKPSVSLYDPYQQSQGSPMISPSHALYPPAPPSNASSPGTSSSESVGIYSVTGSLSDISTGWWNLEVPPYQVLQTSIETFSPYFVEFGFFLDLDRFRSAAMQRASIRSVPLALLNTVILWYIQVSQSEELRSLDSVILPRVLQELSEALSAVNSQNTLYIIQAEVLLGYYFLRNGRSLEARYHCSAAVSLAVGSRLHEGPHAPHADSLFGFPGSSNLEVSVPLDEIEKRERIDAFWTVFILDKSSSVILNTPPNLFSGVPGMQISAPWPLAIHAEGGSDSSVRGGDTVLRFFSGSQEVANQGLSMLALQAQGAALLEKAASMARQYNLDPHAFEDVEWLSQFTALDNLIGRFRTLLPPIDDTGGPPNEVGRRLLATHTLASVSAIQLHHAFGSSCAQSNQKSIAAACSISNILGAIDTQDLGYFNPVTAVLLYHQLPEQATS
ncbi:hypothetical protein BV22DRAFT_1125875 [Leucogyrophana mollusca]|uniref:Uncharacterized protein n=1 Tax=Leucogyrophana mollusca TaxID=85980 RepID=A0ACB8BUY2_9AGAM|nr:hypothetical protein BV22DRAFT_1125875 [Leucogyrophana mollusca]